MSFFRLKDMVLRLIKNMSLRTGVYNKTLFSAYPFMYEPHQLKFLLECLWNTKDVPGACVEVGCAMGATTVFLKKYLNHLGVRKRYIAIDTFSGFVKKDVEYEMRKRGKKSNLLADQFTFNRREWVVESLRQAGVEDVEIVQGDASVYDYRNVEGISFCLIDVDLYKPISAILPKVYNELTPGGVIVVDDCQLHPAFDGALAAYEEFIRERDLPSEIVCEKLGLIKR